MHAEHVSKSRFKAKALEYLRRVEASGVSADGTPLTPQSLEAGGALSSTTSAGELSPIAFTPDRFTWPSDDLQLTGGIRLLDKAPPSLAPGQRTARQPLLIRERRDVTVTEAVVKAVRASRHQIEGRLPIGTRVDVYLMHFDPGAKTESDAVSTDVSVTFPRRIVGVIDTDGGMRLTDSILGAAGTTYADRSLINLGIDEEDRLEFSGDVRFIGSAYLLDQLRVLVIRD